MLIQKPNPTAIDLCIQRVQQVMYERLTTLWGLDDKAWTCYERAYKNPQGTYNAAEVFVPNTAQSGDYSEVFWNDALTVLSFFGVADQETIVRDVNTAKVYLIMMMDLQRLKPGIYRQDAEVRRDVQYVFTLMQFQPTSIITGLKNVFAEYWSPALEDRLKFNDMHPRHAFRINFDVLYNPLDTDFTY